MRVRTVIDNVIGDHAYPARMRLPQQLVEIGQRAVFGRDIAVVGGRVAMVMIGRG